MAVGYNNSGQCNTSSWDLDDPPLKGDIDGDGMIDLTDAMLALQVLIGMSPPDVHSGADVNSDGEIGTAEIICILGKVSELRQ